MSTGAFGEWPCRPSTATVTHELLDIGSVVPSAPECMSSPIRIPPARHRRLVSVASQSGDMPSESQIIRRIAGTGSFTSARSVLAWLFCPEMYLRGITHRPELSVNQGLVRAGNLRNPTGCDARLLCRQIRHPDVSELACAVALHDTGIADWSGWPSNRPHSPATHSPEPTTQGMVANGIVAGGMNACRLHR
jgi:hypothetical protein